MKFRKLTFKLSLYFIIITSAFSSAWAFDAPPVNSYFFIKSVQSKKMNRGYWDQPGHPRRYKKGQNIAVWAKDGAIDQQFRFVSVGRGWYNIISRNGGYVNIDGGRNKDGANIEVWSRKTSFKKVAAQRYRFRNLGNGRWKIYTAWNRVICLSGRKDHNGSNVHTWKDHNGPWMEWSFLHYRTGKKYGITNGSSHVKPGNNASVSIKNIKGKLSVYKMSNGRGSSILPGRTQLGIWYFDRKDKKNPYKKTGTIYTDSRGNFDLGKKYNKYETIFLLSNKNGMSSAFTSLFPTRNRVDVKNFKSKIYGDSEYLLVDTLYRGKQYYYKRGEYFYRKDGKITRRYDFFFPSITKINKRNRAVKKLLSAIGGDGPARTDNEIATKIKNVLNFFKSNTKSSMFGKNKKAKVAADYMFRNCRSQSGSPVGRWPSFQEMADTYSRFGFIPVANCTANTQVAATLLYAAGVSPDKFFVSKFHYNMSWYVEHWVLAVNIGKRWYSIDPQHKNVIKIKSVKDFKKPYWERYIANYYDYKKPFEAWVLPGSRINAVPYLGDPAKLENIINAKKSPMFFIKNRQFSFTSGGMVFSSKGSAVVKKIMGNIISLEINTVSRTEGPKGMENKKRKYNMNIEFKNGIYSTGKGYIHSGKVNSSGKVLNMSGEQSSITFKIK